MSIKTFSDDDIVKIINNPNCIYYIHRCDVGCTFYDPAEQRFITAMENDLFGCQVDSNGHSRDARYVPLDMFTTDDYRDGIVEVAGKTITLDEYISISKKSLQEMLGLYFNKGLLSYDKRLERTASVLYDDSIELINEEDKVIDQVFLNFTDMIYYMDLPSESRERLYPEEFKKIQAIMKAREKEAKASKDEIESQRDSLQRILNKKGFGFRTFESSEEPGRDDLLSGLSGRTKLGTILILEIPKRCFENIEKIVPLFQAASDRIEVGTSYQGIQVLQYAIPRQYIKCAIVQNAGELIVSDNPNYTPDYYMEEGIYDSRTMEEIFQRFEKCPDTIDVYRVNRLLDIVYSEYCYCKDNDLPHDVDALRDKIDRIAQISQFIDCSGLDDEQRMVYKQLRQKFLAYYPALTEQDFRGKVA